MTKQNIIKMSFFGVLLAGIAFGLLSIDSSKKREARIKEEIRQEIIDQTNSRISEMCITGALSTVKYTFSKTVKAKGDGTFGVGEKKILFSLSADVEAGIPMTKYDSQKTILDPDTKSIYLVLPKAEIIAFYPRVTKPKLEYESRTGFTRSFTAEETASILRQGEADIKKKAKSMGILEEAEEAAKGQFTAILTRLGYESIVIDFK